MFIAAFSTTDLSQTFWLISKHLSGLFQLEASPNGSGEAAAESIDGVERKFGPTKQDQSQAKACSSFLNHQMAFWTTRDVGEN